MVDAKNDKDFDIIEKGNVFRTEDGTILTVERVYDEYDYIILNEDGRANEGSGPKTKVEVEEQEDPIHLHKFLEKVK